LVKESKYRAYGVGVRGEVGRGLVEERKVERRNVGKGVKLGVVEESLVLTVKFVSFTAVVVNSVFEEVVGRFEDGLKRAVGDLELVAETFTEKVRGGF
jgi:hypothetical protein